MSQIIGNSGNALQLTIPTRADVNWDYVMQLALQAISTHTHDGAAAGALLTAAGALTTTSLSTGRIVEQSPETLTVNGAVSIATGITILNGANLVMTLANGTEGSLKTIVNIAATSASVTPATTAGVNTATLVQNGSVQYRFISGEWRGFAGAGCTLA